MPVFHYTAMNEQGQQQNGVLECDNARHARDQLRTLGLLPIQVTSAESEFRTNSSQKIPTSQLMLLTRHLAALLLSGITIEEALHTIAEQSENANTKNILWSVLRRLREGHTLDQSLAVYPKAFSPLYRAIIKTGEQTGKLDQILNSLADYLEKQYLVKQKINQALLYPSLLTGISIIIMSFLLVYVVPKIVEAFTQNNQILPWPTRFLISLSHCLQFDGIYILALLAAVAFGAYQILKQAHFKEKWQQFLLKIPLLKHLIILVNTTRFLYTNALLSQAGVDLIHALYTASNVILNIPIKKAIMQIIERVKSGAPLHSALKETGYFDPMSIQLVMSGERGGRLSEMLDHAARNQTNNLNRYLDNLLTLFEPLLILLMGSVVLFIVLAILLPILSLDQLVQLH